MLKVGLVDDSKYDLEKLFVTLSKEEDIQIVFMTDDAEEAYEHIKKDEIDLLVTDIEMPKLSGYELADFITSYALDIQVIFVTGFSGYAVHAFELNVLDYIMKPYSKDRLLKGIARLQKKKQEVQDSNKLVLRTKTDIYFIDKKDIVFIERTGRSTTIATKDSDYMVYTTLNELEEELSKRSFIRSHRSFIINIHFVKNFSLYTKNSYVVSFHGTDRKAVITKINLDALQKNYF
ncbi:LytR/AlgR family response regulator transcription factor [Ectobacillus panaciterrae]|uniref:LytR/AlgR family response regulator transcription factor n=1 Tax=Ectobacillus panaciterrae TaxID=363872 RepID=UPI00042550FB|nr:LytTR family DNA-binding domain-containing protein [Ectobacillus panaciterrae]